MCGIGSVKVGKYLLTGFEALACKGPGKVGGATRCRHCGLAVLKAYPEVPHFQLVIALCMECSRWGMCALGYFLLLSPISAISAVLNIN